MKHGDSYTFSSYIHIRYTNEGHVQYLDTVQTHGRNPWDAVVDVGGDALEGPVGEGEVGGCDGAVSGGVDGGLTAEAAEVREGSARGRLHGNGASNPPWDVLVDAGGVAVEGPAGEGEAGKGDGAVSEGLGGVSP